MMNTDGLVAPTLSLKMTTFRLINTKNLSITNYLIDLKIDNANVNVQVCV